MADRSYTATADTTGAATASVDDGPPAGKTWVIAQFSVETAVFRSGATATITRNMRYITSTPVGSADTAFGPPSIAMNPGDKVECKWVGLTQGDQAILTIWFSEQNNSATPNPNFVV